VHNPLEKAILGLDRALRTVCSVDPARRPNPAGDEPEAALDDTQRRHVAGLMRVNHAGEVAAQALYEGQAATARLDRVRDAMSQAADEEVDHLAWCHQRLRELDSRPSLLNPLWYAGSWMIGAAAGVAGDRWSLGFVAETERQVIRHLDDHLERMPGEDSRSRAILERMKVDEAHHGTVALEAGGAELPAPIRAAMALASKVMTRTAYWV
jgi:3-demethoxyubiquinol 3-hydroxylase